MKFLPNYYLDTEFCEGFKQTTLLGFPVGKPVATIELISLALVTDDGRTYYTLNRDCDLAWCWANEFVRENVLRAIFREHVYGDARNHIGFSLRTMRAIFRDAGQSLAEIAQEVIRFVFPVAALASALNEFLPLRSITTVYGQDEVQLGVGSFLTRSQVINLLKKEGVAVTPVFYAYYGDYDWVVFCQQLFGRMIDLPAGFPKYCRDLKQAQDLLGMSSELKKQLCPEPAREHHALDDAQWNRRFDFTMQHYDPSYSIEVNEQCIAGRFSNKLCEEKQSQQPA